MPKQNTNLLVRNLNKIFGGLANAKPLIVHQTTLIHLACMYVCMFNVFYILTKYGVKCRK